MRYDKLIFFRTMTPGEYNPETGNYEDDHYDYDPVMASVYDTTTETQRLYYGQLKQGSKTIHIQGNYEKPFDDIKIGNKIYGVNRSRELRHAQTFFVSEKQGESHGKPCI